MTNSLCVNQRTVRMRRILCIGLVVCLVGVLLAVPAFAANTGTISDIETGAKSILKQIYDLIKAIIAPSAVVVIAWAAIKAAFSEKGMEKCKTQLFVTLCAVGILFLAPVIVTTIIGWLNGVGDAGVFNTGVPSTNP